MATKYPGKNGLIYMSTSDAGAMVLLGGMRAFTFDGTTDKIDTTEFGATNRTSVIGFPANRGTLEGFWASDDTTLRSAAASADGAKIYLYPSSNAMSKWIGGPMWIDMSLRSAVDQAVGVTAAFEARGAWTNNL